MALYEVVNPSDGITFRTDDVKIAIALTAMLGGGKYGLEDEKGKQDYPTLFLFMSKEQIDEKLKPYFNNVDEMFSYVDGHLKEMVEAIDSLAVADIAKRIDYEKALEHITDETEKQKYKDWFNDEHTSSLNNIYGYAQSLRKGFSGKLNREGEKEAVQK